MTCEQSRELLSPYLDQELDLLNTLEVEAHVKACPECARILKSQEALRSALHDPALSHPMPGGLESKVRAALRREAPGRPARRPLWGLLAAAAVIAVAFAVLPRSLREDPVVPEIVSAHVRSQLADHLVDLASSDQHNVKPWFNGKLDFSLPVSDLKESGFPLVGGRLDYVGGRRVAALVYRRRQHVVNLFVWPSDGRSSGPEHHSRQGYELLKWSGPDLTYWAVSDLNPIELGTFARLIQEARQEPPKESPPAPQ